MYKVMHFVKRKSHLTHEQFRDHFERSHAALALKYFGHLFVEYRRNYVNMVWTGGDARQEGSGYGLKEWDWDLISEWITADEASYQEIMKFFRNPEIDRFFYEDEERFMDRSTIVDVPCEVRDTGTVFNPKGTVFDTPTGEPRWD